MRNDASTFVLGVAGIKPTPDPNINLNYFNMPRAGYIFDLRGRSGRGDGDRTIVDVTPTERSDGQPIIPDAGQ